MIQFRQLPAPDRNFIRLLESTRFGSDGLAYRRADVGRMLDDASGLRCFAAYDGSSLCGAYVLVLSKATLAGRDTLVVYRGLLAVDVAYRGRGTGRGLAEYAMAWTEDESRRRSTPILSFGLIEENNRNSRRLLERLGAIESRTLETSLVYRQWPRPDHRVVTLDEDRQQEYDTRRVAGARGLALTAASRLPAYGIDGAAGLLAAARVSLQEIDLGPGSRFAQFMQRHAYGRFEALGRRYNRRAFRYLAIHDPLVDAEHPAVWRTLVPALLARYGVHMALFTLDPDTEAARLLDDAGVMGVFSRATRNRLVLAARGIRCESDWQSAIETGGVEGGPVL